MGVGEMRGRGASEMRGRGVSEMRGSVVLIGLTEQLMGFIPDSSQIHPSSMQELGEEVKG